MATRAEIGEALKRAAAAARANPDDQNARQKASMLARAYQDAPDTESPYEPPPQETREQRYARLQGEANLIPKSTGTGTGLENFAAGIGESAVDSARQARRLGNRAMTIPGVNRFAHYLGMTPEKNLEALDQETAEARRLNAPLNATVAGKAGQVTGDMMQALALTAATGGLGAGSMAGGGMRALGNVVARDAAAGAVQGALQDTGKGESTVKNALTNAALGAVIPAGAAGLKRGGQVLEDLGIKPAMRAFGDVIEPLPVIGASVGRSRKSAAERAQNALSEYRAKAQLHAQQVAPIKQAHTQAVRDAREIAKEQTRTVNEANVAAHKKEIVRINKDLQDKAAADMQAILGGTRIPLGKQTKSQAKAYLNQYSGVLKDHPDLTKALNNIAHPSITHYAGEALGKIKTAARDAVPGDKAGKTALHDIERFAMETMYNGLGPARAKALRESFESYGRGARKELMPPAPARVRIQPKQIPLNLPEGPMPPWIIPPYSRNLTQGIRDSALRAWMLQEGQK